MKRPSLLTAPLSRNQARLPARALSVLFSLRARARALQGLLWLSYKSGAVVRSPSTFGIRNIFREHAAYREGEGEGAAFFVLFGSFLLGASPPSISGLFKSDISHLCGACSSHDGAAIISAPVSG